MKTPLTGFIEGQKYPYTIIDTETTISTEVDGYDFFDSMIASSVTGRTSAYAGWSTGFGTNTNLSIPNLWFDGVVSETTKMSLAKDFGFIFYVNDFISSGDKIIGNGIYPIYEERSGGTYWYAAANYSNYGALSLNINPTGVRMGFADYTKTTYSDGIIRLACKWRATTVGVFSAGVQIHPDGSVFFFHTRGVPAIVDKMQKNSVLLNNIGTIDSHKVYGIRASIATATGVVYNPAGGVAPNCSVMAFNRSTGRFVGRTKSSTDGSYTLQCAARKGESLFMVCLDDDGVTPDFNAQIIDRVIV